MKLELLRSRSSGVVVNLRAHLLGSLGGLLLIFVLFVLLTLAAYAVNG